MYYLITTQNEIYTNNTYKLSTVKESIKYLNTLEWIAVDTETTGLAVFGNELLTLQLGDSKNQYTIDVTTINILEYKELLESKKLIFQNGKFDLRFLYKKGIVPFKGIYDTYLAECKLTQGLIGVRRDLAILEQKYCNTNVIDKSLRGNIHKYGLTPEVIQYCCLDVAKLHEIKNKQLIEAKKLHMEKAIHLENYFSYVLAYTEFCGIYLDKEKWINKVEKTEKKLIQIIKQLNQYILNHKNSKIRNKFIDAQLNLFSKEKKILINWRSEHQIKPLFKLLGINVTIIEKGIKKESIEAKILQKQKDKFDILPIYLQFSELNKEVTTYGMDFLRHINESTNRIHTNFNQIMVTGRLSSGNKLEKTGNPNLQNVPANKETRGCFTSSNKNTILVCCDYSGMESVVLANKSKEPELIRFYKEGIGDLHSFVASKLFPELKEVPVQDIKFKYKELRQKAKSANFALAYGGTGYTISTNLSISPEQGEIVEKAYFNAFPTLKKFFDIQEKKTLDLGYIDIEKRGSKCFINWFSDIKESLKHFSFDNKKYWAKYRQEKKKESEWFIEEKQKVRKYFSTKNSIRRTSINYAIQGESAMIMKLAMIFFYKWIIDNNYFNKILIVNQIHDEALIECNKNISKIVANKLKECMEKAGDDYCKIIPLKAEPVITLEWQH